MIYPAMKQCPICEKYFLIQNFSQTHRKYCYECSPYGKKNDYLPLYHSIKKRLIELKGGKCEICGYNKCEDALHFHHIDPLTKKFSLSENSNSLTWENYLEESKKCQLLCANCHAEVHYKNLEKKQKIKDNRVFDIPIQQLLDNVNKTKENYCIDCGKKIFCNAIRCEKCAQLYSRVTERPSRENLKDEIRKYSFTDLGKKYNVSDNAIRKWCDTYHLPRTKKEINSYNDSEWQDL